MLEFSTGSSSAASVGAPPLNNSASSMLSMLNMNIHDARNNPFQFLGQSGGGAPLSALNTMADLKGSSASTSSGPHPNNHQSHGHLHPSSFQRSPSAASSPPPTSAGQKHHHQTPPASTTAVTTASASSPSSNSSSSCSGTPHGIQDILSRPTPFGPGAGQAAASAALGSLAGALPRFSLAGAAAVAASQGMYFNPANGNLHKLAAGLAAGADLSGRHHPHHLYWPQMVQNQALWRERLQSQGRCSPSLKFNLVLYGMRMMLTHLIILILWQSSS